MQIKIDLKIFAIILIFLITRHIEIYAILMLFALIHEFGHLICGVLLGFKPRTISIIPYGFKLGFQVNYKDYNIKVKNGNKLTVKKIIIALAGPITNIICLIIIAIFRNKFSIEQYQYAIYSNILLILFNLMPIYPLDGGRIVQGILHIFVGMRKSYNYIKTISYINIIILTTISSILILCYKNIAIFLAIIYLWAMVYKCNKEIELKEKMYEKLQFTANFLSISN